MEFIAEVVAEIALTKSSTKFWLAATGKALNITGKGVRKIAQVVEAQVNPGKPKAVAVTPEGMMLDVAVEDRAAAQGAQAAEDAAAKAEALADKAGAEGRAVQEMREGVQAAEKTPQIAEQGQAHEVPVVEGATIEGPYSGELIKVPKPDAGADTLARKLNGESRMKFSGDPIGKEFDVISNEFIAESKPAMRSIDRDFRIQAKRVFEAARQTGRKVYFHFNGEPCRDIIRKLQEYQRRYGIEMIIDTEVLY